MEKMTAAVRLTLAYKYITGRYPQHIRVKTYVDANRVLNFTDEFTPEVVEQIVDHPLMVAHAYMLRRGFLPEKRRGTSHTIQYHNNDGIEGGISRSGTGWIWTKHPDKPGLATEHFNAVEEKKCQPSNIRP